MNENIGYVGSKPTMKSSPADNIASAREADYEGFARNPNREKWPRNLSRVVHFSSRNL
jgi:hypothetical protein